MTSALTGGLRARCPTYAGVRSGSDWALAPDEDQASAGAQSAPIVLVHP